MTFESNQPIYMQIMDHIKKQLACGKLQPGARVASVRELAIQYGVNPNTVQKALSELERDGYLKTDRTAGRLATSDTQFINQLREREIDGLVSQFYNRLAELNVTEAELAEATRRNRRDVADAVKLPKEQ